MLTHKNMVACIAGADGMSFLVEENGMDLLNKDDRMFFYLPLAHGYGQTALVCFIYVHMSFCILVACYYKKSLRNTHTTEAVNLSLLYC